MIMMVDMVAPTRCGFMEVHGYGASHVDGVGGGWWLVVGSWWSIGTPMFKLLDSNLGQLTVAIARWEYT